MGPAAAPRTKAPIWNHQLTEEERQLRDLAFPLIQPPYDRGRWYSVLGEIGLGGPYPTPDRAAYASRLFQTPYRSQTGRYNQLMEDIRNDIVRLDPFFSIARRVADLDKKREKSLAIVSNLTVEEKANTLNRIRENTCVTQWVHASLLERAASYRIMLERLVIAAPSQNAVEAERQLGLLDQRIKAFISYGT